LRRVEAPSVSFVVEVPSISFVPGWHWSRCLAMSLAFFKIASLLLLQQNKVGKAM
jgi:hypothetical protein